MSLAPEHKAELTDVIKRLVSPMNMECEVVVHEEKHESGRNIITASVSAPEHGKFLIGKNGQNLQALEHIVRSIFLKAHQEHAGATLFVDVNDYKKSRATQVAALAREVVARVRSTQRAEALNPMTPHERRIVHMELASMSDIATESIGQEPQRRIVIKPYRLSN